MRKFLKWTGIVLLLIISGLYAVIMANQSRSGWFTERKIKEYYSRALTGYFLSVVCNY